MIQIELSQVGVQIFTKASVYIKLITINECEPFYLLKRKTLWQKGNERALYSFWNGKWAIMRSLSFERPMPSKLTLPLTFPMKKQGQNAFLINSSTISYSIHHIQTDYKTIKTVKPYKRWKNSNYILFFLAQKQLLSSKTVKTNENYKYLTQALVPHTPPLMNKRPEKYDKCTYFTFYTTCIEINKKHISLFYYSLAMQ